MSLKLTKVDPLLLPDHYYLSSADECYFVGEYTARAGFSFSETNDLIQNLKKPMERLGRPEWKYKEWAIQKAGRDLRALLPQEWLRAATVVPVPPSKIRTDPAHDDRLIRVLEVLGKGIQLDCREIVTQNISTTAAHEHRTRPRPEDLIALYCIDPTKVSPFPQLLVIFDDVLTTGCHFRAMAEVLTMEFPGVPIVGLFLARRVPQSDAI